MVTLNQSSDEQPYDPSGRLTLSVENLTFTRLLQQCEQCKPGQQFMWWWFYHHFSFQGKPKICLTFHLEFPVQVHMRYPKLGYYAVNFES